MKMNEDLLVKFNEIEKNHWWWVGRREVVQEFLEVSAGDNYKILDVGCGTGETMTFIKSLNNRYKVWV